jgi:hypothetical protein
MAIELATAYVSLATSAKGIEGSIGQSLASAGPAAQKAGDDAGKKISSGIGGGAKQAASTFKNHIGGLAAVTGAAFGAGQVLDFFGSAIGEAKESAKVSALTANVIKTTGKAAGVSADQVGDLATKISNYAGIDDEAVQSGQNLLLTFTNVKDAAGKNNDIFSQSSGLMADMSVALGQDMSSSAMQLGKALNDPAKGITALSRAGVSFTAQQKDQIKAMVKGGDTLGAQKIILGELNKEFGGAAKAAANPADKLQVAWGNFQEQLGTAVLPMISKLASFLTEDVVPALSQFLDFVDRNSAVIGPLAAVIGLIVGALATFVGITKIATAVQAAYNVVMALNPVMLVVLAIIALIAIVVLAYKKVDWFRNAVNVAFAFIKNAVSGAVRGIVAAFRALMSAVTTVKNWIVARWNDVISFVRGLPGRVTSAASSLWNGIKNGVVTAYNWVTGKLGGIVDYVRGLPGRIGGFLGGLFDPLLEAARSVLRRVASVWNSTLGGMGITIPKWVPIIGGGKFTIPKMPTFAAGGQLQPGWNLVGEAGAELIHKAGGSARVYSAGRSAAMAAAGGGGAPVNVTVPLYLDKRVLAEAVFTVGGRDYAAGRRA